MVSRVCIFTLLDKLFLCFFKNQERKTVFHSSLYKLSKLWPSFHKLGYRNLQKGFAGFYPVQTAFIHAKTLFQHLQDLWQSSGGFSLNYSVIFSVKSLSTACQVSTALVFTWMWPKIIFPEPRMTRTIKTLCPCNKYQCFSRKFKCLSRIFKFRTSNQNVPAMFMPYIEDPKIDRTVNDGLHHSVLKWKLKCENILDCALAMLPESKKCKKVTAWSGDFGMDQYVSWYLPVDDFRLDTLRSKYEEFCKPQENEVGTRFDLLTSFCQGNRSGDEWYNAVQAQVCLAKYLHKTANTLYCDIFWFFFPER